MRRPASYGIVVVQNAFDFQSCSILIGAGKWKTPRPNVNVLLWWSEWHLLHGIVNVFGLAHINGVNGWILLGATSTMRIKLANYARSQTASISLTDVAICGASG